MNKKEMFTAEYGKSAPKSMCVCGHSGDGAHSDHSNDSPVFMRKPVVIGHGRCKMKKCECERFTWKAFTLPFEMALKKIK